MNGKIYVCTLSRNQAAELGMEEAYWESYRRNEKCAGAVKKAISEHYDGWNLKDGCAKKVIGRFGYERVDFVLAYNIRQLSHDGRISPKNKEWAERISVPLPTGFKGSWLIQSHPGLLDLFIKQVRSEQETGFFTEGQWQEPENEDFEGRLLLLDIARVRERYPTADCQMFYCMEDTGTEVIGFFLKDNSMDCFQHSDFLGELKPEFTPAWVPDALEDMGCSPGQLQDMGMRMNF